MYDVRLTIAPVRDNNRPSLNDKIKNKSYLVPRTPYIFMTLYGIKNCSTVKSAIDWLKKNNVEFEFHDYKKSGITDSKLKEWSKQVGWESLINKRGTTWRQLGESIQNKITSEKAAIDLMKEKTSVIKRPLIEQNGKVVLLGFDEAEYKRTLS